MTKRSSVSGRKVSAALVGLGRIGSLLEADPGRMHPCTHAGALFYFPEKIHVTAAADPQKPRRKAFADKWNFNGILCRDHKELLARTVPDLLVISTPSDTHFLIAMEAVSLGVRGIILEKPVSLSLKEAGTLKNAVLHTGCLLLVCHDRRFSGQYQAVRRLFKSGSFGPLLALRGELYTHHPLDRSGCNPLLHDGTHLMDIACYLAGKPLWLDFSSHRPGRSGSKRIEGSVGFAGGVQFRLSLETRASYYDCAIELTGSNGRCRLSVTGAVLSAAGDNGFAGVRFLRDQPVAELLGPVQNPYIERTRIMLDLLCGKRKKPVSGIVEGFTAQLLCEKAWESFLTNRPVDLTAEMG
ncbi:MAG: Gfo/Idh/MocA family oxidoreductase [Candidatus Wallbacteria bacterium]|nr:Gfo/Idh/MocA family oxidoreductase [Candidatus Wallbacteria bacterium]